MEVDITSRMKQIGNLPCVSAILVILNIIVFLICTFTGDLLYNMGSVGVLDLAKGEYYRLFTSMFLHADTQHLINNMLLLFGIGYMIEAELGHFRFGVYYLLSGVGADFLSAWIEIITGEYVSSIGASGAVFGLDGILLALVLWGGKKIPTVTMPRLLFMIVYSLYSGFAADNINNAAHVGGLITGFFIATVYCLIRKIRGIRWYADGRTEDRNEY